MEKIIAFVEHISNHAPTPAQMAGVMKLHEAQMAILEDSQIDLAVLGAAFIGGCQALGLDPAILVTVIDKIS